MVISAWTVVVVLIQFLIIDKILGLRLSMEEEFLGADAVEHDLDHQIDGTTNHESKVTKRNVVQPLTTPIPELENHRPNISGSEDEEWSLPILEEDEAQMEIEYELIRRTKDEDVKTRSLKKSKPNVKIIITPPSRQGNHLF